MANTNRPTTSTHQQLIVPPNGDAVLGRSSNKFRYYNNFPLVEKQIGQDPKYYVKRRPPVENTGIVMSSVPGLNGVGSVYYEPVFKTMWFTNQRTVVMTNNTSTTPTEDVDRIIAPTAGTGFPETSIEAYLVGDTHYICVMATTTGNFTRIYFYSPAGTFLEEVAISAASFRGKLVFLDGYLFAAGANQRIYNSTIGNPKEWLIGANFLDAEMDRDPLLTLAKHHNHIVGFGSDTIEFFYNNANEIGSPLQRQVAYASREVGLFSHLAVGTGFGADTQPDNSLVEIGEVIYFIGSNDGICQGLYKIENFKVTKVSDHSLDLRLRETIYPKLSTFDLNGESCVLLMDQLAVKFPVVFIPSLQISVEFQWDFVPTHSISYNPRGLSNVTVLFKTGGDSTSFLYSSGYFQLINPTPQVETFTSQYTVDYIDFNNNANKHFKYVDVLGSFESNQVAIGYRKDNFGYDNGEFINLPYISASAAGPEGNLRFRNLGYARRQGYTVFVNGPDDYLYKGVAIGYNQWGE